ncbi:GNAT family N-acetyltransferase [Streptomyces sp. NPDC051677]|uniref:GNAT family N-acetyltransferase n=1 Tax=Streptomyces sp. NPDC051677 TaxID=3365669 RepID=UPI0037D74362
MQALHPLAVSVNKAVETDLAELVRVDHEAFPEDPYPESVLRQFMDTYTDHLLLAKSDGVLCGYVLATPPCEGLSWIFSLGVAPGKRQQGLGRQLMKDVLENLRKEGAHTVNLWVDPRNTAAIGLYESLRFVPVGEPHEDYFGPGKHRRLMRLTL